MKFRQIVSLSIALVITVTTCSTAFSAYVLAKDNFYINNNIMFYDPNSCVVGGGEGGSSSLVGNDNLEKILRYYVGKGLTLAQAAGIAGNYQQESGFNPAIIQGGAIAPDNYTPVNGVGFGIAQWTFTGRQAPLVALGKSTNRPITDLSLQLDYSWQEMETRTGQSMNLDEFKATTTPEDAAYIFHRDYEVSADDEAFVKRVRGGNANSIYQQFSTIIPDNSTQSSTVSTAVCTGDGKASAYAGSTFQIYSQNDPKWANVAYGKSTIGAAGCGPSAMAMIITALTSTAVTPLETANYGAANGTLREEGTKGSLANVHSVIGGHWGLKATQLSPDVAKINQSLRSGSLVVVSGRGPAPFIAEGHYIVIRGVTADGKWMIGDSNGEIGATNSTKEWDPGFIVTSMDSDNIWGMSK